MNPSRWWLATVVGALVLHGAPAASVCRVQDAAIAAGVDWLRAIQDGSGVWGVTGRTPWRDTAVVIDTLLAAGVDAMVSACYWDSTTADAANAMYSGVLLGRQT